MTDLHAHVATSIIVLLALVLLAMALRRVGLVSEEQGALFSALVTKVTLPALIFVSLSRIEVAWAEADLAVIMAAVSLICLALGWVISAALRLAPPRRAAVILTTGFGSSSLLGFALVAKVFPGDAHALGEAAILSGLGVQPLLFTLGALIALYHGSQQVCKTAPADEPSGPTGRSLSVVATLLAYLRSPVFLAFVGGTACGLVRGASDPPLVTSLIDGLDVVGSANTFLVTLAVGVSLRFDDLREVAGVLACVSIVKLAAMPAIVAFPARAVVEATWQLDVLVLESAMPSAMLSVVFCRAYGCDARLAARLVLGTTALSAATAPLMFELLT